MAADSQFHAALRDVAEALSEVGAPWMILGGVAVIAAGVPRETIDVDATVLGRRCELDELLAALERHGITPRVDDAVAFARERQVLLLRHVGGVTVEISFAWLPFEEEAIDHAIELQLSGVPVRLARPEDLIVYKAAAWRDRDRSDIERLLVLHVDTIDLTRVRALVTQIARALDDPSRVSAFDALVRKVREER